ncbi:serine hydrolase domain-containing protein [Sinomonas cellulolyticus]|uniref:Beta-lactamase family protein n=1 Tax=Sinomonas cellulolyticus TaxID=2801916 RepID=A0ABS1K2F9_9MICC|nr:MULTISPECIES: serine hydrolase domain-containing protein [Sinomonas]MBL0705557.1 beta-lactamase family protein [Sinomonas cellulolyticus]
MTRPSRAPLVITALSAVMLALGACTPAPAQGESTTSAASPPSSADPQLAARVRTIVTDTMAKDHLNAVIVRVTVGGQPVITEAFGESMPGVPATADMHFRNGAVSISYMSTALLQLVDEKKVSLDDKLATWLPDMPHAGEVTLGQLAQMTSGYADYVQDPGLIGSFYDNPFRTFTPEELAFIGASKPLFYTPGTNWDYAHTNYVLLGLALEKITGQRLDALLEQKVLGPLGLKETHDPGTPAIPEPALHAYTSERRPHLGIPAATPFLEDSTYWNPSWTLARGAIETTTITDMATTADAIGSGRLLSPESHALQVSTALRGKTHAVDGCPTCFAQGEGYTYGLGVVISGNWLLQNPMFAGFSAVEASLPSKKIAIAVAATYKAEAFDAKGETPNRAQDLFRLIGAAAAPDDAPPVPKS